MRLRRDARATLYLEESDMVLKNPQEHRGSWKSLFGNDNPIHVEFGSGKGGFITQLAKLNEDINYIAVEKAETVVYKACKRAVDSPSNLYFLYFDVAECLDIFEDNEVDRIYLNFSDPWPKTRYAKRRLTYRYFLDKYEKILALDGELHFKTDNKGLFASSLEEFSLRKWLIKNVTLDLHSDNKVDNVMTEYEKKFSELGFTINRLEAIPNRG